MTWRRVLRRLKFSMPDGKMNVIAREIRIQGFALRGKKRKRKTKAWGVGEGFEKFNLLTKNLIYEISVELTFVFSDVDYEQRQNFILKRLRAITPIVSENIQHSNSCVRLNVHIWSVMKNCWNAAVCELRK